MVNVDQIHTHTSGTMAWELIFSSQSKSVSISTENFLFKLSKARQQWKKLTAVVMDYIKTRALYKFSICNFRHLEMLFTWRMHLQSCYVVILILKVCRMKHFMCNDDWWNCKYMSKDKNDKIPLITLIKHSVDVGSKKAGNKEAFKRSKTTKK